MMRPGALDYVCIYPRLPLARACAHPLIHLCTQRVVNHQIIRFQSLPAAGTREADALIAARKQSLADALVAERRPTEIGRAHV